MKERSRPKRSRRAISCLGALALFFCLCAVVHLWLDKPYLFAPSLDSPSFRPTPENAELVFVTDDWIVWRTTTGASRFDMSRAPDYIYRYYIQRDVDEPIQRVAKTTRSRPYVVAGVLSDGSLWCYQYGGYLIRFGLGEAESFAETREDRALAVYDDGALLQRFEPNKRQPVYFVPWAGEKFDMSARALITDRDGVYVSKDPIFLRNGSLLAWTDGKPNGDTKRGRGALTVHVYDLKTGKRSSSPKIQYWRDRVFVWAFDGEILLADEFAFDIRAWTLLPLRIEHQAIAVKDRVAYAIRRVDVNERGGRWHLDYALTAYDVDGSADDALTLMTWHQSYSKSRHSMDFQRPPVYAVQRNGLRVWDGKRWHKMPWATRAANGKLVAGTGDAHDEFAVDQTEGARP